MPTKSFFAVLFILTFLTSGAAIAADAASVSNAEAKAKSNFDHIKLAEYYENEANVLKAKVEEQRKLLEEYKNHSEYYGREGQDFESHHEALLREYTKAAERNNEMAVSHRNMAKKVK
jgi:hypothetical protein